MSIDHKERFSFQLTTSRRGRQFGTMEESMESLFQLTTSRRGRQWHRMVLKKKRYFNSRPHEEVDATITIAMERISISTHDLTKRSTWFRYSLPNFFSFQLTTSRRGRQYTHHWPLKVRITISTHDLTKRSTDTEYCCTSYWPFQLTTSRRGRRVRITRTTLVTGISTHDLTKRSTKKGAMWAYSCCISTHDLTKRSTNLIFYW